jgi:hypothetical protein
MSSRNLHVTLPKGVEEDIVLFFSPDDLDSGPMTFWESPPAMTLDESSIRSVRRR